MDEAHFNEIERVLLFIGDARERSSRAANDLRRLKAEPHLVEALDQAERGLRELHRKLMQATYFAVPPDEPRANSEDQ